jgi:2',3'-cyclic-nucleotide 2'-phosphodiesterase
VAELTIAFLGDVVGSPGRSAVARVLPILRERHKAAIIIVNGENSRNGSGLSPDNYRELRRIGGGAKEGAGVNAITLCDHCFRDRQIIPILKDPAEPVARPANLAARAPGKRIIRLETGPESPPLYILTVLGRLFMPVPADSPFDTIDRELGAIPEPDALVLVEAHCEATSEKVALAWYCLTNWTGPGKPAVVAVLGTHTHVQTADARILEHRLAAMTDVGMTGPHRSVIGRHVSAVLEAMSTQAPIPLDVASDDVRAQGCVITIDTADRRAVSITPIDIPAG